jgi:hypothetical protein
LLCRQKNAWCEMQQCKNQRHEARSKQAQKEKNKQLSKDHPRGLTSDWIEHNPYRQPSKRQRAMQEQQRSELNRCTSTNHICMYPPHNLSHDMKPVMLWIVHALALRVTSCISCDNNDHAPQASRQTATRAQVNKSSRGRELTSQGIASHMRI